MKRNITMMEYTEWGRTLAQLAAGFFRAAGKQKVFCIGLNKTGTTSMAKAFNDLGLVVGLQRPAELLLKDWARRDFHRIFLYCHTAQAFQDIPFSLPFTFQALDRRFPGSKFILTLRDSPEQWYESLTRFHASIIGRGRIPTMDDLMEATYNFRGAMYVANRLIFNTPPDDPYNQASLISYYNTHNMAVLEYFRHRPEDLLALNVAEPGAYERLSNFLGKPCPARDFPWENKTAGVDSRGN